MGGQLENLRRRLDDGAPLLLDSAMGTELERRGVDSRLPLWSARALLDAPQVVLAVHRENVEAGADILTANTFRTQRRTLSKAGLGHRAKELTDRAVALAREASMSAGRLVFVVGSLSPLEDCYRPDLVPEDRTLGLEHSEQAQMLAEAGVDGILVETQNSIRELVAAARAASQTGLPVFASMVTDGQGRLLSEEPIESAASALRTISPDAVGVNCVPARRLGEHLRRLSEEIPGVPMIAYGNATRFAGGISPQDYALLARDWLDFGVRIVGGCCGTTPSHIEALRRMIDKRDA